MLLDGLGVAGGPNLVVDSKLDTSAADWAQQAAKVDEIGAWSSDRIDPRGVIEVAVKVDVITVAIHVRQVEGQVTAGSVWHHHPIDAKVRHCFLIDGVQDQDHLFEKGGSSYFETKNVSQRHLYMFQAEFAGL